MNLKYDEVKAQPVQYTPRLQGNVRTQCWSHRDQILGKFSVDFR